MSEQTDKSNEQSNLEKEVPDLDEIISQITSNGEFQNMMNNLSGEFKEPLNNISNNSTKSVEDKPLETQSEFSDLMTAFLTDSEGTTVGDILTNINNNLSRLNDQIGTFLEKKN